MVEKALPLADDAAEQAAHGSTPAAWSLGEAAGWRRRHHGIGHTNRQHYTAPLDAGKSWSVVEQMDRLTLACTIRVLPDIC